MSGDTATNEPLPGFFFGPPEELTEDGARVFVVEIPASIRSKQKLLRTLAEELRFPAYFGHNWDALEECLRDLSWLPEGKIQVRHHDLPLSPGSQDRRMYLQVLRAAASHRPESGSRELLCQFPAEAKEEALALLVP